MGNCTDAKGLEQGLTLSLKLGREFYYQDALLVAHAATTNARPMALTEANTGVIRIIPLYRHVFIAMVVSWRQGQGS